MKVVRTLRDLHYMHVGTLKKGEIVFTNKQNRIVQGEFMNQFLFNYDCEIVLVTELNQELLQRREEVKQLMIERDDYLGKLEAEKVVLPKEVADEIQRYYNKGFTDFQIIGEVSNQQVNKSRCNYSPMAEFATRYPNPFLRALADGYTIEQPQTFQTNRKLDASEIRTLRKWYEGALIRIKDGRDPDEYCKEAIEEVALYLGGATLLRDISPFCKNQLDKEKTDKE